MAAPPDLAMAVASLLAEPGRADAGHVPGLPPSTGILDAVRSRICEKTANLKFARTVSQLFLEGPAVGGRERPAHSLPLCHLAPEGPAGES